MVLSTHTIDEPTATVEIIRQIAVIDAKASGSKELEIVFPKSGGEGLHRVSKNKCELMDALGPSKNLMVGTVTKVAVTPVAVKKIASKKTNIQFLALFNEEEKITVAMANLDSGKATQFDAGEGSDAALEWCGTDSVVLVYEDKLVLVGNSESKADFDIEHSEIVNGFYVRNEVDGLRIFTNKSSFFVEKVSGALQSVMGESMGSKSASAAIILSYQKFLSEDPRAEDTLEGIKEDPQMNLADGVEELLEAARGEFHTDHQMYLIRAASFSKNFLPPGDFDSGKIVETINELRILNQLRLPKVRAER